MFEHATIPPTDTAPPDGQPHRVIPADLVLPPPALLWEWLSYIYRTTGEWWRPPFKAAALSRPEPAFDSPRPAEPLNLQDFQGHPRSTHQPTSTRLKTPKTPAAASASARTGFDYRASRYYEEAGRLTGAINGLEKPAECHLVLSFIIAWSRFPLFENLPATGANWMALAFSRCAGELKMRASTFKECLAELEKAGLVRLAGLAEGLLSQATLAELQARRAALTGEAARYWNAHFFQKHTTLYLLAVPTDAALPVFNPFGESLAGAGKPSKPAEPAWETTETPGKPFPLQLCNNESKNENDEFEKNKLNEVTEPEPVNPATRLNQPAKLELGIRKLNIQSQSIYQFIIEEARFAGYCRAEDGRETLDEWEALKFAASGRYSLEQLKTRYAQVKEVWESRSGCHNPLALLHWTLTQDVDPRRGNLKTGSKTAPNPAFVKPENNRAGSFRNNRPAGPGVRPQLSYQKRMFSPSRPGAGSEAIAYPVEESDVVSQPDRPHLFVQTAGTREPERLWKVVCEDLAGRFQLGPLKQELLKGSTLHFAAENDLRVEVVLRSIWEERQLDGLTRNVINLALRQRLGPGLEVAFLSA